MNDLVIDRKATPRAIHYIVLMSVPIIWGSYGPILQRFVLTTSLPIPFYNLFSFLTSTSFLYILSRKMEIESYPTSPEYKVKLLRGGVELGVWLFLGSTCLAYGLQTVGASKAAIILSLKSVNVSILECLCTNRLPNRLLFGTCFLAVYGVYMLVVSVDNGIVSDGSEPIINSGCVLVLAASCFYSMHIFRLGVISNAVGNTPLYLATVKGVTMSVLTLALICTQWLFVQSLYLRYNVFAKSAITSMEYAYSPVVSKNAAQSITSDEYNLASLWIVSLCILWNGCVSIGYSMWAQVYSQKCIPSTAASFVYATTPLAAIFWSWAILIQGIEVMTWRNWLGGAILMGAVFLQLTQSSRFPKSIQ